MATNCGNSKFYHEGKCCALCPQGEYARSYCNSNTETVCETCPHGQYTESSHAMLSCLPCRKCYNERHQMTDVECAAGRDRQCKCTSGFFCTDDACEHCKQVTQCRPGSGVTTKSTKRDDTVCKPCLHGTFSNVTDASTPCYPHTSCEGLGKELKHAGNSTSDAVCGDFLYRCHWMLPASLWAGLGVTILIIIIGAICWRKKRPSKRSVSLHGYAEEHTEHVFTPDILNHPMECDIKMSCEAHTLSQTELFTHKLDGELECDAAAMPTTLMSETFNPMASSPNSHKVNMNGYSACQSEPQEDEWPGS